MMPEQFIRLGSVVVDKATGQALRVVDTSHQTGGEHQYIDVPDLRQWGVTEDSTVYECVYLPTGTEDDNAYPPSQTYAFAEEQLFRYHCEHALPEGARRIHTQIVVEFLAAVLEYAKRADQKLRGHSDFSWTDTIADAVIAIGFEAEVPPEILLEEAAELADASIGAGDRDE